ncbi:hypothetical protein ACFL54_08820, partial [Planctomycetota bacterium]
MNKEINPEQLEVVAKTLADALAEVRGQWFAARIEEITTSDQPCEIVNSELGGTAEFALKAYQCLILTRMLVDVQFCQEQTGKMFEELTVNFIGAPMAEICKIYYDKYAGGEANIAADSLIVAEDIAEYTAILKDLPFALKEFRSAFDELV